MENPQGKSQDNDRLILAHHVAVRAGVTSRTVRNWARGGVLPAIKLAKKIWYFRTSDVEAFLAQNGFTA